jgi:uncharacterized cupin superfamily protein
MISHFVVDEAKLAVGENGQAPASEGWFVLNARDAPWSERKGMRRSAGFEGGAWFPEVGINVSVLDPGKPSGMYHSEPHQEGFLILSGECLLLVEGQERPLRAWDYAHLPAGTAHVLVGAGAGPCVYIAVGGRSGRPEWLYHVSEVAQRHGAGVAEETPSPDQAYAAFPVQKQPYRDGDLPRL